MSPVELKGQGPHGRQPMIVISICKSAKVAMGLNVNYL